MVLRIGTVSGVEQLGGVHSLRTVRKGETMTDVEWLRYMAEQYTFGDYADERKADYLRIAARYERMEKALREIADDQGHSHGITQGSAWWVEQAREALKHE